jgi:hypothetical protein
MSFNKTVRFVGSIAAAGLSVLALSGEATALNLNTSGAICNPYNAGEANDIDYVINGVRTKPGLGSARNVICAVPRSPASSPQYFYIDGSNSGGATTYITLYAHNYDGTYQSSHSVSSAGSTYDLSGALSTVGTWSYISALVTLPANAGGTFFGVAVQ